MTNTEKQIGQEWHRKIRENVRDISSVGGAEGVGPPNLTELQFGRRRVWFVSKQEVKAGTHRALRMGRERSKFLYDALGQYAHFPTATSNVAEMSH